MMSAKFFKHRFDDVRDYLHHREPYLMVDDIVSIDSDKVVTEKLVTGDEFFLPGHFPGAPIFPGAMMQELTTQSAGILLAAEFNPMSEFNTMDPFFNEYALGVLVKVKNARYKKFARTGDRLRCSVKVNEHVGNVFEFSASVSVGQQVIMRNQFQLMNVESAVLQGT